MTKKRHFWCEKNIFFYFQTTTWTKNGWKLDLRWIRRQKSIFKGVPTWNTLNAHLRPSHFWTGRSPQKLVAVHPKSSWPFTPEVRDRSPQELVAVHLKSSWPFTPKVRAVHPLSSNGRPLKMGVLFSIGCSFSPFSLKWGCFSRLAVHLVRSRFMNSINISELV